MAAARAWQDSTYLDETRQRERYETNERRAKGTLVGGITIVIVGALFCFVFYVSGGYLFHYGLIVIGVGVILLVTGAIWLFIVKSKKPASTPVRSLPGLFNVPPLAKEPPPPYSPPVGRINYGGYSYDMNGNPRCTESHPPGMIIDESGTVQLHETYPSPMEASTQTRLNRIGRRRSSEESELMLVDNFNYPMREHHSHVTHTAHDELEILPASPPPPYAINNVSS